MAIDRIFASPWSTEVQATTSHMPMLMASQTSNNPTQPYLTQPNQVDLTWDRLKSLASPVAGAKRSHSLWICVANSLVGAKTKVNGPEMSLAASSLPLHHLTLKMWTVVVEIVGHSCSQLGLKWKGVLSWSHICGSPGEYFRQTYGFWMGLLQWLVDDIGEVSGGLQGGVDCSYWSLPKFWYKARTTITSTNTLKAISFL